MLERACYVLAMDTTSDAFKWWLTGISDGESCFNTQHIAVPKRRIDSPSSITWRMQWQLVLRADDLKTIQLVHSYVGGNLYHRPSRRAKQNPNYYVIVSAAQELFKLVDHFERYPLQSKKARDFEAWAEAVRIWHGAPVVGIEGSMGSRKSVETHARVMEMHNLLKSCRAYNPKLAIRKLRSCK